MMPAKSGISGMKMAAKSDGRKEQDVKKPCKGAETRRQKRKMGAYNDRYCEKCLQKVTAYIEKRGFRGFFPDMGHETSLMRILQIPMGI